MAPAGGRRIGQRYDFLPNQSTYSEGTLMQRAYSEGLYLNGLGYERMAKEVDLLFFENSGFYPKR